jgi:hypothetical protein
MEMCTIFSAFEDWGDAQQAVGALLNRGAHKDDIDLVTSERYQAADRGFSDDAPGATRSTAASPNSKLVPGVGLVIGEGALAAAAVATAEPSIAGGIVSYLVDQGVSVDSVRIYQETVKHGGALLALRIPSNDFTELDAFEILAEYHATQNVYGSDV